MSTPINIPKLGVAMTEGVLAQWLADDGAAVEPGQAIYVLETDKVESEIEAPVGGVLRRLGEEGERYVVGEQVAEIV
jgi:pyruvate dehydrogenase E2 component (dihydrolipoamide acetyltransferase)/2-oxoglutarate dehydrogenase E2 component (dihydrolipoamide succinyltransferase)